jgi:hypothetical protein
LDENSGCTPPLSSVSLPRRGPTTGKKHERRQIERRAAAAAKHEPSTVREAVMMGVGMALPPVGSRPPAAEPGSANSAADPRR